MDSSETMRAATLRINLETMDIASIRLKMEKELAGTYCVQCTEPIEDEPIRTVIGPVHFKCARGEG